MIETKKENINIFKKIREVVSKNILGPMTILLLVIFIFSFGTSGNFISIRNIKNILNLTGLISIMALGSSMPILIGGIDLSLEGLIALFTMICGLLIKNSITNYNLGFFVFPLIILLGFLTGSINGLIHTKLKIPSFMVTLGMTFIGSGLAVIIGFVAGRTAVIPLYDTVLQNFANGELLGIPNITILALIVVFLMQLLQKNTAFGKYVYAIGDNEILAEQAGVNINKVKIIVFGISGCLYAFSAFLLLSRFQAANPLISKGYLFSSITAVVVGGGLLSGGVGSAIGTFVGAMIVTSLANGMILMDISPYIQDAINGIVLIVAVALTIDRKKLGIIK
jgi:ribose/xylose/arabinose/galactoside ABC-type transport system permease subunit